MHLCSCATEWRSQADWVSRANQGSSALETLQTPIAVRIAWNERRGSVLELVGWLHPPSHWSYFSPKRKPSLACSSQLDCRYTGGSQYELISKPGQDKSCSTITSFYHVPTAHSTPRRAISRACFYVFPVLVSVRLSCPLIGFRRLAQCTGYNVRVCNCIV